MSERIRLTVASGPSRRALETHWPVPWPAAAARPLVGPLPEGGARRPCWSGSGPGSWHGSSELAGPLLANRPGYGQGLTRARRPGPERVPEISANPPTTGGARPCSLPGKKRTAPGRHRGRGRAQPERVRREAHQAGRDATGRTGTPKEKEKGS